MNKLALFVVSFLITHSIYSQNDENIKKDNCSYKLMGIVKNLKTNDTVPDTFIQLYSRLKLIDSKYANADATFSFDVDCNKRYNVKTSAENFAINSTIVISTKKNIGKVWEVLLYPIQEFVFRIPDKLINVKKIKYVQDKATITPESLIELDKVAYRMKKYPDIFVSINVHTDSRGVAEYDLKITQQRADFIMGYLIDHGIDSDRLDALGYGSTQLLNDCTPLVKCSEAEHQINNRTDFIVMTK
jgi:outer membrane protein OmpA-like peptidoglycan-associated protein